MAGTASPTFNRKPHPHPTDLRECAHSIAAPHRGQSRPAGGRQHDQPQPLCWQYQKRNVWVERTPTESARRHFGQVRDHSTCGRQALSR
jgi:hypothetical protein